MATRENNSGLIIKDYIVKEKLGTGSYGVVYKVIKKSDKQVRVLKRISLFNMNRQEIEDVKNEANILASLNNAYIVKYYDSFVESNNLNIIMEYCDGGDLSSYLNFHKKTGKTINEDKIWKFFIQICLGLTYIHKKNILHRDLKSLNIFLTKDEKVRIGDLGVAKVLSNTTQMAKTFVGTPYYLSPEICEEKPYNEKSDMWALGCILYEMTTYKHPFNANNQGALILKILKGKYDPIGKDYSQDLRKMIELLLEKNHFKRPNIVEIINNQVVINKSKALGMYDLLITCGYENSIKLEDDIFTKKIPEKGKFY